jgi:hypothetical protein
LSASPSCAARAAPSAESSASAARRVEAGAMNKSRRVDRVFLVKKNEKGSEISSSYSRAIRDSPTQKHTTTTSLLQERLRSFFNNGRQ